MIRTRVTELMVNGCASTPTGPTVRVVPFIERPGDAGDTRHGLRAVPVHPWLRAPPSAGSGASLMSNNPSMLMSPGRISPTDIKAVSAAAGGRPPLGGRCEAMIGVTTNCLAVAVAIACLRTAPPTGGTRLVCRCGASIYRVCISCADPANLVAVVTDGVEVSRP